MANHNPIDLSIITLQGRELWNAFTECVIYEDMFRNSISGYINVMESENIRETIPIIGEEFFVIRFASKKAVAGTSDEPALFVMKVTKLTEYTEGNTQQKRYRLHFQSLQAEANRTKRIRKAYEGTGSGIVSTIMQEMFGLELETNDGTKHTEKYVFPNWNPFKCIDHISKCSVSAQYNDPYYVFYEDRDGFHFTSLSKLFDKPVEETVKLKWVVNLDDENQDEYLASNMNFKPMFDALQNEMEGMYGGKMITYDKIGKLVEETDLTYSDTHGQFKHIGKQKLTKAKVESPKNSIQLLPKHELKVKGQYANVDDWATQIRIREGQFRGLTANFTLNRATSLKLGSIIEFEILNETTQSKDKILSGKWMLTRMKHNITPIAYTCQVEAVKDGLG